MFRSGYGVFRRSRIFAAVMVGIAGFTVPVTSSAAEQGELGAQSQATVKITVSVSQVAVLRTAEINSPSAAHPSAGCLTVHTRTGRADLLANDSVIPSFGLPGGCADGFATLISYSAGTSESGDQPATIIVSPV